MAYHADRSIPGDIDDWLYWFEIFLIYEIFPEILELWREDIEIEVKSKKHPKSGS